MPSKENTGTLAIAAKSSPRNNGPRWRALLEARWRERLQEVTELSLAYHAATVATAAAGPATGREGRREQQLMRRAVSARRKLADTEEALGRLTAGQFGRCEQCRTQIPGGLLATAPEVRYCPRCDDAGLHAG